MLFVWRGQGLLALLIMLGLFLLPLMGAVIYDGYYPNATPGWLIPAAMIAGFFAAGWAGWLFGRRWNRDARPGETHMLYFVRVEHWGIVSLVLGAILASLFIAAPLIKALK